MIVTIALLSSRSRLATTNHAPNSPKIAPEAPSAAHGRFLQLATNALSDSFFYGAPVYLALDDFADLRVHQRLTTRDGDHGGAAVVNRAETFFRG